MHERRWTEWEKTEKYRWFRWKTRKKNSTCCVSIMHWIVFGSLLMLLHSCKWLRQFYTTNTHTHNATERLLRTKSPSLAVRYIYNFFLHVYPTASLHLSISLYHAHTHIRHRTILNIASTRARAKFINRYVRMAVNSMFRMWMDEHVCACWNECEQKMLTTTMDFVFQRFMRRSIVDRATTLRYTHHSIWITVELFSMYLLISLLNIFLSVYASFFSRCVENMFSQKKF